MNKVIIILALSVLLLGFGYFIFKNIDLNKIERILTKTEIVTRYDTLIKYRNDTLIIRKNDIKTFYYNSIDTIFITKEFEKSIDTTIEQSRLQVSYFFPADSFRLKLHLAKLEILRTDSIKVYIPKTEYKNNVYLDILYGIGGGVLGYLIAK
ncbi:MAG: hypothetical protein RLY43_215 [Bacteroidota bacterium]|jgi:hypothetical protein